ncbi:MAG: hypothetical protein RRY42_06700 [Mucinivorans sp.]
MARSATIDKFRKVFFEDFNEMDLSAQEAEQLRRIRAVYTLQLDNPMVSSKEIVSMLGSQFGIKSIPQAYRDIAQTNALLGSVPNSAKQWTRYMVTETLKGVITRADFIIENSLDDDVIIRAMDSKTKAADKLAKYARLDQADPDPVPYEDIVGMKTEFTTDPAVMGIEMDDPQSFVEKVKKQYVEFEEVEK